MRCERVRARARRARVCVCVCVCVACGRRRADVAAREDESGRGEGGEQRPVVLPPSAGDEGEDGVPMDMSLTRHVSDKEKTACRVAASAAPAAHTSR